MATRLEITHGLIAERDRLSTSADTLSVTRPQTGSKTRSKGVLFVVVAATAPGPRTREATQLVAETIRHEYYYDESAGVPVCLEKAIKSADRRLRGSREGAGLAPGSLGVAAAVIRNNECYDGDHQGNKFGGYHDGRDQPYTSIAFVNNLMATGANGSVNFRLEGPGKRFDNLLVEEVVQVVRKGPLEAAARALADLARRRMLQPEEGHPSKADDLTFIVYRPTAKRA